MPRYTSRTIDLFTADAPVAPRLYYPEPDRLAFGRGHSAEVHVLFFLPENLGTEFHVECPSKLNVYSRKPLH